MCNIGSYPTSSGRGYAPRNGRRCDATKWQFIPRVGWDVVRADGRWIAHRTPGLLSNWLIGFLELWYWSHRSQRPGPDSAARAGLLHSALGEQRDDRCLLFPANFPVFPASHATSMPIASLFERFADYRRIALLVSATRVMNVIVPAASRQKKENSDENVHHRYDNNSF